MITIQKSFTGNNGVVRVTFSMPAIDGCDSLYLVGWFSEWDESVYPMDRTASGAWVLTLELESGCTYQYHYRTLDGRRLNDPAGPPASARIGLNTSFVVSRNRLAAPAGRQNSAPPS